MNEIPTVKSFSTFYQLKVDKPIQLCLHIDEEWENSFIALDFEGCIFTLRCESNQFLGERINRKQLTALLYESTFGKMKAERIDEDKVNGLLRQFVDDLLKK